MERVFGAIWAVLLVTALFAGVHYLQYANNLGVVAVITMLSLSLTLVRAFTGRLLPCFMMHLVFNGIQSLFIVFAPYIERLQHPERQSAAIVHLIESVLGHLG